jgi:predicted transcriptional regulator
MQKDGLVEIEARGKKRIVKLTEKGIGIANLVQELMNKLDNPQ